MAPLDQFQRNGDIRQQADLFRVLRQYLSQIILRRTQNEILRGTLPPRTDITLYVDLNPVQRLEYDDVVLSLLR